MNRETTWPRPCPYCRGYNLERRWCSHCDKTGYDPRDMKQFYAEQPLSAPGRLQNKCRKVKL